MLISGGWLLAVGLWVSPLQAAEGLVSPAEIREDVLFWERVYGRVDSTGGVLHDDRDLAIVYSTVVFEAKDHEARVDQVERERARIQDALANLADHSLNATTDLERQCLALWGSKATADNLREAASHVRFQLGQADRLRAGLARAAAWKSSLQARLTANGVPDELWALTLMESAFNVNALSKRGAAGLWQLMPEVAQHKLRMDDWVDERFDPMAATQVAAEVLSHNFNVLQSWPLAVVAYNHGLTGVLHAKQSLNSDSVVLLMREYHSASFGFASRNYYAEFLAVRDIADHPTDYGIVPPRYAIPPLVQGVASQAFSASRWAELAAISMDEFKSDNPALRPQAYHAAIPKGVRLTIPKAAFKSSMPLQNIVAVVGAPETTTREASPLPHYTVTLNDTPASIAARFHMEVARLLALNHLKRGDALHLGQVLTVSPPGMSDVKSSAGEGREH